MAAQTTFINSLLEAAFRGDTYTGGTITMKLFKTALPSAGGTELSGGSYAAQTLTFSAAASKAVTLSSAAVFSDLSSSETVYSYGIYDGATLIDEKAFSSTFTPTVDNNELQVTYTFSLAST